MSELQKARPKRARHWTVVGMQPTYLPWLGYFDLVDQGDAFIFLDNVQFDRRSWQQRNRIKTPRGLEYLTVPVLKSGRYDQLLKDVEIIRSGLFPDKHLRVIEEHYRRAPYFDKYYPELAEILKQPVALLSTLNGKIIQWLAAKLGLSSEFGYSSALQARGKRGSLLAGICAELGATTYLSPIGSFEYLEQEHEEFTPLGITLRFQNYEHPQYRQRTEPFVPYASVLDLLFNEGERSREILLSGRRPPFTLEDLIELKRRHGTILSKPDLTFARPSDARSGRSLLVIRADGGVMIGTGHVMRCLSLAQGWRVVGEDAAFVMRATTPALEQRLRSARFELTQLTALMGTAEDALQTVATARQAGGDWVVVDGYHFKAAYQRQLKEAGLRVLMVDDYGHAENYCADLVLNQNLTADPEWYARRAPYTRLLLGTRYALLREQFAPWRDWRREIPAVARKVLVTLGGADPDNVTGQVIEALRDLDVELKVVVGGSNPYFDELSEQIRPPSAVLRDVSDMAELMAWADVVVSAGGTTSYEIAFMGLPNLVLVLADNQRPVAAGLDAAQVALQTAPERLADDLRALLTDAERRAAMSQRGRQLVDGLGVSRVVANLRSATLCLRPVREEDCRLIWVWSNDPDARAASMSPEEIPWDTHRKWFADRLKSPDCLFYVAMDPEGLPIGQIRFDLRGDEAVLSISLARGMRRRRYGPGLILLASDQCFAEAPIQLINAYCKPENASALRAFELTRYRDAGLVEHQSQLMRHFILNRAELNCVGPKPALVPPK